MAILMLEWLAQLGLIGALIALLWSDPRVAHRLLRLLATIFFLMTFLAWNTSSLLFAVVPPDCDGGLCTQPEPWGIVGIYSHNAASFLFFFGAAAWVVAVIKGRHGNGA